MAFITTRCGEEKVSSDKNQEPHQEEVSIEKETLFVTEPNNVVINWTSFKLSEKVSVGGTFDSISVDNLIESNGTLEGSTILEVVKGASLHIYTSSVNSKNPERDTKISDSFFGTMVNSQVIDGAIIALEDDGTGILEITMNEMAKQVDVLWEVEDLRFKMTSSINIQNWSAQSSLDSLNNVCSELHRGSDGESVLWPDVDIEVFVDFNKKEVQ